VSQLSLDDDGRSIACVHMPAMPLQLLLRAHPDWEQLPVVVVEDDRPLAKILFANRHARAHKIVSGVKFGQAKALSSKLRAAVVPNEDIETAVDALFDQLLSYSPHVEPAASQPGLFWLDPSGLGGLFGDLRTWAQRVHAVLEAERYIGCVAVGFKRPFLYAVACQRTGAQVIDDPDEERTVAEQVPLERLLASPDVRNQMALLGVETVGRFMRLPAGQLRVRYGHETASLHDFLNGRTWTPLQPRIPSPPLTLSLQIEPADDDHTRLLFGIKNMLHGAIEKLGAQSDAITALDLTLHLDHEDSELQRIETAAPTLDVVQIIDLVRLRLSALPLAAAVEQIDITFEHTRVHPRQVELLQQRRRRDLAAAGRALARLRASFGPQAVTRAQLRDAYLPEASFRFEPITQTRLPQPPGGEDAASDPAARMPLVRRVLHPPVALPPLPAHEPEAWLGHHGTVQQMLGPYRTSGGWWTRRRERDYYFIETQRGEVLWAFYDRPRRRWFLHGFVN